jgi:hypothetical protein
MRFRKKNKEASTSIWKSISGRFVSSSISWLVIILIISFYSHKYINAEMFNTKEVIRNDVISYYNYLPAAIVYNDLTFTSPMLLDWNNRLPDGRRVNKTTMGVAYFYAPFFLVTYEFFKYNGYKIDVYSPMFQFAIGMSGLLACLLAMIVMRKNLKRFFSDIITSLCLLIIFLGTNLYYYGVYEGAFSHMLSLFLISLLIHFTFNWYKKPSVLTSILLGLVAGWIVLIRPVNIVFCLFPLLYGQDSFKGTLLFWKNQWLKILLILVCACIIWIPQIWYWKFATGHYFFFSYTGETFFWTQPEIMRGFFSYRNGWLVYTPIMALSLIGLFFLYRKQRKLFYPVTVIFILNTYIIYCWWCWWYSGFGSRAMIDSYAFLVFPVGALLAWMMNVKKILISFTILIISGLIYLNIFQSWQKFKGIIHWDGMTKELYWAHFLKEGFAKDCDKMVKRPDYEKSHTERCD